MGRVDNKVVLVTGAARGQGRSHAVRLAEEGADVIAIDVCEQLDTVPYGMSSAADLAETARQVEALGRRISTYQADVRDLKQLQKTVEAGVAEVGPIDIVVANAGIFSMALATEMSAKVWQDMIDVNLTGVFNTVRATTPSMVERGAGGSVVLISSTAGIKGIPGLSHYSAAKHGVIGLMKATANELGAASIRVNCVLPTTVNTDMVTNDTMFRLFRPDLDDPGIDDFAEITRGLYILPEPWVEPRDVSHAVLFLASDESRCVTGLQLTVDLGNVEK